MDNMEPQSFDQRTALLRSRYAQAAAGATRGNAPPSAPAAQGGQGQGSAQPAMAAAPSTAMAVGGGVTPMNPGVPGVPPIFPSGGAPMWAPAPTNPNAALSSGSARVNGSATLDGNISRFQNAAAAGVQGFGDMAGQDFRKSVGEAIGGLNGIGALRSGAAPEAINDITTNYARQIGDYASMTSLKAAEMGQNENDNQVERAYREKSADRARHAAKWGAVGKLVGAGVSLLPIPGASIAGGVISGLGG